MEASSNQNTEPMHEREKRVLEHIDYVLAEYDKLAVRGLESAIKLRPQQPAPLIA